MLESASQRGYYRAITKQRFIRIVRGAANDVLDSLDMRPRPARAQLIPGQAADEAWVSTGRHLRKAMDYYAETLPKGPKIQR